MKHLIFILLICLSTGCNTDCEYHFYYSPVHEQSMLMNNNPAYQPQYVNGIKFTQKSPSQMLVLYKKMWEDPQAIEVFIGCPDTLDIKAIKEP